MDPEKTIPLPPLDQPKSMFPFLKNLTSQKKLLITISIIVFIVLIISSFLIIVFGSKFSPSSLNTLPEKDRPFPTLSLGGYYPTHIPVTRPQIKEGADIKIQGIFKNQDKINWYADKITLFFNIDTEIWDYTWKLSQNSKELKSYQIDKQAIIKGKPAWEKDYSSSYYGKFSLEIPELKPGENQIYLAVYSPNKSTPIAEKKIIITRLTPQGEISQNIELTSFTPVDSKVFSTTILNADSDLNLSNVDDTGVKITIQNTQYPLYRIYSLGSAGPGGEIGTTFFGYVQNKQFYYFTNAFYSPDSYVSSYYSSFLTSPYTLAGTLSNLTSLPIENSSDKFVKKTEDFYEYRPLPCKESYTYGSTNIKFGKPAFLFGKDTYKAYRSEQGEYFFIKDRYQMCGEVFYEASYYEHINIGSGEKMKSKLKLKVSLNNGKSLEHYYTIATLACRGGVKFGLRILPKEYESSLVEVGKTPEKEPVYILSQNAPYSKDSGNSYKEPLILLTKIPDQWGDMIGEEEWNSFLNKQINDYPLIIIKNPFNHWILYISEDYTPNCGG